MFNNKNFKYYIHSQMGEILSQDNIYKDLQTNLCNAEKVKDLDSYGEISIEIEARVLELSYMQGFQDAIEILNGKL